MMKKERYSLKGSALAYGLVIMTSVAIILTSIIGFVATQTKYSLQVHAREEALQIAEAGIHFYKWYLAHTTDGRTAQQIQTFWDSGTAYGITSPYEAEYADPSGGAVGKYRVTVTPPVQGSTIVTVRSVGWTYKYPSDIRTLEVRFRRPSWSENAVLANNFMRFGAGTEVFGRIHSNYGIRFDGIAHNIVTSSVLSHDDPDHGGGDEFGVHTHDSPTDPLPPAAVPARADVFEAGRTFPVATVDFNGVLGDLSYMKSEAVAGVNGSRYFSNGSNDVGRRIILKTNGTFDTCKVAAAQFTTATHPEYSNGITSYRRNSGSSTCGTCSGLCLSNYTIPDNGIIFVEDRVWLDGQISNKKVTVAAADLVSGSNPSVYIGNDITYSAYNGNDIIGIIGQNNIEIIRDSDTNLRIDAALLAQQGRVGREYYDGRIKSAITIYGAIATNLRYGFAYTDGTGYQTRNLYYDNNLLYYPPPYFPTGTQYEMDLWEEK